MKLRLKTKEIIFAILFVVILTGCMFLYKNYAKASELGHVDSVVIKSNDVKVPKTLMSEIKQKLKKLNRIEKSEPNIKLGEIKVFTDKDGRIFINDTTSISLKLADIEYAGELKLNAKTEVYRVPEKELQWYNNFGWEYGMIQKDKDSSKFEKGQFYLTYDTPLAYKRVGTLLELNRFNYGAGIFYKIGNTKLIGSAIFKYGDRINKENAMYMLGIGYNF